MIKASNETALFDCIVSGLKSAIVEHGVIRNDRRSLRSAAKRVLGALKGELYSTELRNVKRIRTENGYEEKVVTHPITGPRFTL